MSGYGHRDRGLGPAGLILLLLLTMGGHAVLTAAPVRGGEKRLPALPHPAVLTAAAGDGRFLAADYLWLTAHRRLAEKGAGADGGAGGGTAGVEPADFLGAITDLDPWFRVVYLYAATYIAGPQYRADYDGGERLLRKACRALPRAWVFPFFLGMMEWEGRGDVPAARKWFGRALAADAPPRFLADIVALLLNGEAGTNRAARLRQLAEGCRDAAVRDYLLGLAAEDGDA
ncbi:MAG: hypothetical protein JW781_06760 [Deltaproteobacteria bacterium]|nr:hypothetical protein [Candidatus Anaeroferrophillacea bacterium]